MALKTPFVPRELKDIKGELVKIREFTQVIFFVISLKNHHIGLKIKVLKFLGIQTRIKLIQRNNKSNILELIFESARVL